MDEGRLRHRGQHLVGRMGDEDRRRVLGVVGRVATQPVVVRVDRMEAGISIPCLVQVDAIGAFLQTVLEAHRIVAHAVIGAVGAEASAKKETSIAPVMRIEPLYPKQAAEQGISGSVVLKYDITPAGKTANITVVKAKSAKRSLLLF